MCPHFYYKYLWEMSNVMNGQTKHLRSYLDVSLSLFNMQIPLNLAKFTCCFGKIYFTCFSNSLEFIILCLVTLYNKVISIINECVF